jgi:hypothetical protein
VRTENEAQFGATTDWRPNKFIWYGTSKAFNSLTLTFRESDLGVFCVHHYRYKPDMSTFLVEVTDATWRRAGFEHMSPQDTISYCEKVFAHELEGHPIISNFSHWRNFPAIWNERWYSGNVVLLGDALRTAHFSIGSGTRLAMEDSVALYKAFQETGGDVAAALPKYQALRWPPARKIWDAANISLRWYEKMDEYVPNMQPVELAYSYMLRTGRVSVDDLRRHDPELVRAYEALHPPAA